MTVDLEPVSISVEQAAKVIGIGRTYAYDLASKGRLPGAYRMGNRILVHRPTLLADIEAMATKIAPSPKNPPSEGSVRAPLGRSSRAADAPAQAPGSAGSISGGES